MSYKWKLEPELLKQILLEVNTSFFGFITDNMLSAYIGQEGDKSSINLIILYKKKPSKLDNYLVKNEVLSSLEDELFEYGIRSVNLISLYGEDVNVRLGTYKDYFTIFKKYLKNRDDSVEANIVK